MTTEKYRNYITEIYPDSVNPDWEELLAQCGAKAYVSPLHDSDMWTEKDEKKNPNHVCGELKKAHRHVCLCYDTPRSINSVRKLCDRLGFVGLEVCESVFGSVRYHMHMDNPEKAQYDIKDELLFGGASLDVIESEEEKDDIVFEVLDLIIKTEIEDIRDLYLLLKNSGDKALLRTIKKNSFLYDRFCAGNYKNRMRREEYEFKAKQEGYTSCDCSPF